MYSRTKKTTLILSNINSIKKDNKESLCGMGDDT